MQSPLTNADTLFEQLLQDLPPETLQRARSHFSGQLLKREGGQN